MSSVVILAAFPKHVVSALQQLVAIPNGHPAKARRFPEPGGPLIFWLQHAASQKKCDQRSVTLSRF